MISNDGGKVKVFVPCSRPDAETDQIPLWVKRVPLNEICSVNIDKLPYVVSNGMSWEIKKGENYFLVHHDDRFEEECFVLFAGD